MKEYLQYLRKLIWSSVKPSARKWFRVIVVAAVLSFLVLFGILRHKMEFSVADSGYIGWLFTARAVIIALISTAAIILTVLVTVGTAICKRDKRLAAEQAEEVESADESIAGIKPRKPLLSVTINNRFLLITLLTVLLSGAVGLLVFINSPEHLATALYELSSEMDEANPGSIYHDAYTKARSKRRKEVKAEIKAKQLESATNKETSTILEQYLEEPVIVRKIIYGSHNDKLVMFRIVGKDI